MTIKTFKIGSLVLSGLTLLLFFQNCSGNSFSNSALLTDESIQMTRFDRARSVLIDNCLSCHGTTSPQGSVTHNTEEAFINSGWVMAQSLSGSKLITRLKNYPVKDGSQTMPTTGSLSSSDYQILVDWVQNMSLAAGDLKCNPNESIQESKIKRLTENQFKNSVQNAFGNIFAASDFPVLNDANPRIGLADNPNLLNVTDVNFNTLYESSALLTAKIVASNSTVTSCITASGNTCFTSLVQNFGRALWRRPLTTTEQNAITYKLASLTTNGHSRTVQAEYVLKSLILSPNHLFRTELGQGLTGGLLKLTHYEVASLLSFAAWDSPPDTTLLNLADQGQLHNTAILKQQVARLTADARFQNKMTGFIIDLLKIENIKTIKKDSNFAITTAERTALYESARLSIANSYSTPGANLFAPFSMSQFHLNNQMTRFMTGGSTAQFTPVALIPSQRHGVLSHPAFLTSIAGEISTGIVRRGVYTLEQLLCDKMPSAPADVTSDPDLIPGFNPETSSSREILRVTHSSRSDCMGCHVKIDPAGFAFESFDTFGVFRMFEKGNIPIDSSGSLAGIDTHPIVFNDSVAFFRELNNSASFKSCINRRFFEYATGFSDNNRSQQCEVSNFEKNLKTKPQTTSSLLEAIVELPSFINRRPATAK